MLALSASCRWLVVMFLHVQLTLVHNHLGTSVDSAVQSGVEGPHVHLKTWLHVFLPWYLFLLIKIGWHIIQDLIKVFILFGLLVHVRILVLVHFCDYALLSSLLYLKLLFLLVNLVLGHIWDLGLTSIYYTLLPWASSCLADFPESLQLFLQTFVFLL